MNSLPIERIINTFLNLSVETDPERWTEHCKSCAVYIESRLKSTQAEEDELSALCYAAACLAFYRYTLKESALDAEHFKAGDIAVNKNQTASVQFAKELFEDSFKGIRNLMLDGSFKFKAV